MAGTWFLQSIVCPPFALLRAKKTRPRNRQQFFYRASTAVVRILWYPLGVRLGEYLSNELGMVRLQPTSLIHLTSGSQTKWLSFYYFKNHCLTSIGEYVEVYYWYVNARYLLLYLLPPLGPALLMYKYCPCAGATDRRATSGMCARIGIQNSITSEQKCTPTVRSLRA